MKNYPSRLTLTGDYLLCDPARCWHRLLITSVLRNRMGGLGISFMLLSELCHPPTCVCVCVCTKMSQKPLKIRSSCFIRDSLTHPTLHKMTMSLSQEMDESLNVHTSFV